VDTCSVEVIVTSDSDVVDLKVPFVCACFRDFCSSLIVFVGDFQVSKKAEHLPHIWDLTVVEMVVRAAKHVLKVCVQCAYFTFSSTMYEET